MKLNATSPFRPLLSFCALLNHRRYLGISRTFSPPQIGSLIIPSVRKRDTGNYTCSPSNSAPVTVNLHVIHGNQFLNVLATDCPAPLVIVLRISNPWEN